MIGTRLLQVRLREHAHALAATVLGEDKGIPTQSHGARLEAIAIDANGLVAPLHRAFVSEAKTALKWE